MLTKDDVTALRRADQMSVHLSSQHPKGLVRLIKRKPWNAKPFETDQEYMLSTVAVRIETWRGQEALDAGNAKCFELVSFYHDQMTPASCIVKTLRVGDEVTLAFHPDGHSNGYVAAAGLHADILYLIVRREGKMVAKWKLDVSICPDNSARMCHGVPTTDDYRRSADERRQLSA